ncbi:MAG TPA: CDP-archaeol synthase [Dehalococcoidia bacterium]|nr:CDP-archaeol synthase [Dehalococcoidia bacterium]
MPADSDASAACLQPRRTVVASSVLRQRLLSAALLLPPLLAIVWLGGPWYAALVTAAALIGVDELYRLARAAGRPTLRWPGLAFAALLLWLPKLAPNQPWGLLYAIFALLGLPLLLVRPAPSVSPGQQGRLWTVGGALYLAWPLSSALLLRELPDGRSWTLFLLLVTFSVDTGAYAIGRAFGRRRLAPRISPGKTWEGAIGGALAGVAASALGVMLLALPVVRVEAAVWGLALAIAAQAGDLYESALKRRLGTKEASGLIPGHGGLLDRLDSVLATSLMLYWLVLWRGAPAA